MENSKVCTSGGSNSGGCGCGSEGSSGKSCSTGGCNKLNVFNWLVDMDEVLLDHFDILEIRFKGGRKEFFRNTNSLELYTGDPVMVDTGSGVHLGFVSMQGELVRIQMRKKAVLNNDEIKSILRKASQKDIDKYMSAKNREMPTLFRTRNIAMELKLNMKLSDVEFQADNTKATFYYSADDRVDFRELIKLLAGEFKVRVEMKQISLRQEAGRLGGIGVCGRELCCSTWLTDFKNVNTTAARYQNLSINPTKLSGQCGRLKCCLNYELETYMDAWKDIPQVETPLQTIKGAAFLQKTDIFRRIMWFSYKQETDWYPLPVADVVKVLEMNKAGQKPEAITPEGLLVTLKVEDDKPMNYDLLQMDKKYSNKKKKKKPKPRTPGSTEPGNFPKRENLL
ncbi:MAG: Signal peptidase-like protein [Opitutaceae bacterium]|nr:Signal peptidase-like protein [Cytophagales bacterium]